MDKVKIRKIKKENQGKRPLSFSSLVFAALSLLLTGALFIGLLFLQNFLSKEIVYKQVVVAKADIPANTILTEENAADYLTLKQMNVLDITKGGMEDGQVLIGQKAKVDLLAGEILTLKDFEYLDGYTKDFTDPVEISIDISEVANADGGKIRGGDLVNITMMFTSEQLGITTPNTIAVSSSAKNNSSLFSSFDEIDTSTGLFSAEFGTEDTEDGTEEAESEIPKELTEADNTTNSDVSILTNTGTQTTITKYNYDSWAQYVMQDIYVNRVLNSDGISIDPSDTNSNAAIVIFTIEKSDEADINNALMNCQNLRISKVLNKPKMQIPATDVSDGNVSDTEEG